MKLADLINKLDDTKAIFINGKKYDGNIPENMVEKELIKINIEAKNTSDDNLESLGYSCNGINNKGDINGKIEKYTFFTTRYNSGGD